MAWSYCLILFFVHILFNEICSAIPVRNIDCDDRSWLCETSTEKSHDDHYPDFSSMQVAMALITGLILFITLFCCCCCYLCFRLFCKVSAVEHGVSSRDFVRTNDVIPIQDEPPPYIAATTSYFPPIRTGPDAREVDKSSDESQSQIYYDYDYTSPPPPAYSELMFAVSPVPIPVPTNTEKEPVQQL